MSSNNPSVRQFRTDMLDLVNRAKQNFHATLLAQADELAGNIRRAIPHSITGHQAQSVRVKDVSTDDETKLSVLVMAGGPLTTRRTSGGASHDYALDEEFGNVKEDPRPFFYSTARFYKQHGLEQFQETLDQTIAENNIVRGIQANNNYTSNGYSLVRFGIVLKSRTTISSGYRGAIAIQK